MIFDLEHYEVGKHTDEELTQCIQNIGDTLTQLDESMKALRYYAIIQNDILVKPYETFSIKRAKRSTKKRNKMMKNANM